MSIQGVYHIQMFTRRQARVLYAIAAKKQRRCHTKITGVPVSPTPPTAHQLANRLYIPDFLFRFPRLRVRMDLPEPGPFPVPGCLRGTNSLSHCPRGRLISTAIIRHGADSFRGVPRSRPDLHGCSLRLRNLVIVREDVTVELGDEIVPIIMWVE